MKKVNDSKVSRPVGRPKKVTPTKKVVKVNRPKRDERIRRVLELIGQSKMTFQICDICQKEWNVKRRQVERYLTYVYKFLNTSLKETDRDKILLEYSELIQRFEAMGDMKMAMLARERRDKIQGNYINKVDITSGGETIIFKMINPNGDKL